MRLNLAHLISWSGFRSWRTGELSRNFSRAERGGKVADNTPTLYSNYKSDTCTDVWIKWEIREIWQTKCEYHWPSGYYGYHLVAMVTRFYQYLEQVPTHLHSVHVENTSATAVFLCRVVMMGSKETIVTTQKQKWWQFSELRPLYLIIVDKATCSIILY